MDLDSSDPMQILLEPERQLQLYLNIQMFRRSQSVSVCSCMNQHLLICQYKNKPEFQLLFHVLQRMRLSRIPRRHFSELQIPDYIINEFAQNEPALTNFNNLPKSHKRYYVLWITSAKKEETILNRLKKSTELLKENKRLGI